MRDCKHPGRRKAKTLSETAMGVREYRDIHFVQYRTALVASISFLCCNVVKFSGIKFSIEQL